MTPGAWWMLGVTGSVIVFFTTRFFWRVLMVPGKPDGGRPTGAPPGGGKPRGRSLPRASADDEPSQPGLAIEAARVTGR